MKINHYLWALWGAMILSMIIKWKIDTFMVVALIILPILIVLLELHEEIAALKEEAKHQRKFVMDRYNVLSEKMSDLSSNLEKKIVVDFSEFARENPPPKVPRVKKKKKKEAQPKSQTDVDLSAASTFAPPSNDKAEGKG